MRILFKYPSRSRPANFFRGVKSITENVNNKTDFKIYATLDENDTSMNNDEVKGWMLNIDNLEYTFGKSESKIHACNRDMFKITNEYNWDIVVLMSDDMIFLEKGFDDIIRQDMINSHPTLDGVLHYNDGFQKDNLMTMTIMGRTYYERQKYLYEPSYKSLWCDVEETEKAFMQGKHAYFSNQIFIHKHPAWGIADWDEQYRKSEGRDLWDADLKTLKYRRSNNYFLNEIEIKHKAKYGDL